MSTEQRPWWLVISKSKGLVTTVEEEFSPDEQRFIIRGEPVVQGLAWLIWGPVAALLVIILVTGTAIALQVNQQPWQMRFLFIILFLLLPALVWGGVVVGLIRLSRPYLQAIRQTETKECFIRLNRRLGQLVYQTTASPAEKKLAYEDIEQASITYPIGEREGRRGRLILNTSQGTVVLLDETLGTRAQKMDLAHHIGQALAVQPVDKFTPDPQGQP